MENQEIKQATLQYTNLFKEAWERLSIISFARAIDSKTFKYVSVFSFVDEDETSFIFNMQNHFSQIARMGGSDMLHIEVIEDNYGNPHLVVDKRKLGGNIVYYSVKVAKFGSIYKVVEVSSSLF